MKTDSLRRAILGGCAATAVLIVLMYLAPFAGLPRTDMASVIGGFLGEPVMTFAPGWWIGFAVFILVGGVISPVLYAYARAMLFGSGWQRGVEWGLLLWTFGGVCVMVHLGLGFHEPFVSHPHLSALMSVLAHVAYGAVLGAVCGIVKEAPVAAPPGTEAGPAVTPAR